MMNRMVKTIIIRKLTEEDNKTVSILMRETGCYQASKAVMKAAYSFVRMSGLVKQQAARIKELEAENYVLRRNSAIIVEAAKKLDIVLSKTR